MVESLRIFYSSVGRKLLMALTGLFLIVFLLEHLYGNLQLYKMDGGKAFNHYGDFLVHNIVIRAVEYFLFAAFIAHALDALFLTQSNRKARPVAYAVSQQSQNSTWFSRNMGLSGTIVFFFLVIHLRTFFFAHRFGGAETSMAHDVAEAFQSNWYAALYLVSMILLGAHLNHGFQSAFQTLGLNNKKYRATIKMMGTLVALLFMVGYGSFPIMFYFDIFGVASNILHP
jgi:succinate dehydrogenase / fumarate reductase cytochrome b subunit